MGIPELRRPLGRPEHRWEDCIKTGVEEIDLVAVEWIELAQVMDLRRELLNISERPVL